MSNTRKSTPDTVRASETSPQRALRLAARTSQSFSCWRNSNRWNATGAMTRAVVSAAPDRTIRYAVS